MKTKQALNTPGYLKFLFAFVVLVVTFLAGTQYQKFTGQNNSSNQTSQEVNQVNQTANQENSTNNPFPETATVIRIIDGDTIQIENKKDVRYVGMTAPEKNQKLYNEATELNRKLSEGKIVRLEYDAYKDDKFGRILAYVWVIPDTITKVKSQPNDKGEINVPIELVRQGMADVAIYEKRRPLIYQTQLLQAKALAQKEKLGIWK